MKSSKKDNFVATLSLLCEQWQQDYLDKVFCCGGRLYNLLAADRKTALLEMESTREWRTIQAGTAELFKESDGNPSKEQKKALDALYLRKRNLMNNYGFSEYAFHARVQKWRKRFKALIGTHVAQKIAAAVWKQFEAYFFGNGKEIHFKPWTEFTSIEGKTNGTGIRFLETKDYRMVLRLNKTDILVKIPDTPYMREALNSCVKYCRIVRTPWHGKHQWLYSLQLVLEGTPPERDIQLGNGRVGIDIGTQTIAVVGDKAVALEELAPKANMPDAELRRINRAMDRSRRATNPAFFDKKGCIVPVNKLPPECIRNGKRLWKKSRHYKELEQQRRYLYAKLTRIRRWQHKTMTNWFLPFGNKFYCEKMNFKGLQKKAKSKPPGEKQTRRKRFGKSIANKAPALFLTILKEKVKAKGGTMTYIDTWKAKASQYDHMDNGYHKKKLSQRWHRFQNGDSVQRDLYSAFLIQHTNSDLDAFNREDIERAYPNFKQMHDEEVKKLQSIQTPSSTGVKRTA